MTCLKSASAAIAAVLVLSSHAFAAPPLSLREAQRLAVERSRELNAYDSSVSASRELAVAARQLPDPVVRAGVDNLPIDRGDKFSLTRDFMTMRRIGVMQEFTRSEKRELRGERYTREADKTAAERLAVLAAVQRDTALAWIERYYVEAMLKVADEQISASQTEVESADAAYRGGRGTEADVFAARSALVALRDRRRELERRARAAAIGLARWTGSVSTPSLAEAPSVDTVRLAEETLEAHLASHPEIVALEKQAEVAEADVGIAKANRHPDWTWEASYQQRGPAYSNMVSIGVSIPLPWDAANRQDREVAAKLATVEEIRARRDEMLRAHVAEVAAMIDEWKSGRERRATYWKEILALSRERTDAALAAYRGGKSSLNDVLAARREEFDTRLQALQLDLDVARLWARLNFLIPEGDDLDRAPHLHPSEGAR